MEQDSQSKKEDSDLKKIQDSYIEAAKNDSFLFGDYDYEKLWRGTASNDIS